MSKLVKINDRKPMEIFIGRKTRGPVQLRLDESVIGRLLRAMDPPREIYAVNNDGTTKVKLTLQNYQLSEAELFNEKKDESVNNTVVDNKTEDLKRAIEDLNKSKAGIDPATEDEAKSTDDEEKASTEDSEAKVDEETVVTPVDDEKIENTDDKVTDGVIENKEIISETRPQQYNNNNYSRNNKYKK